ncbi:D-alanyl-D-alanine carboxypeptidase family protein [Candidatus Litorirhabdus singularis]|nr:D-alanyl-D-alanine carboxypeptidase [Candidatus Litorirhabdus singularis]
MIRSLFATLLTAFSLATMAAPVVPSPPQVAAAAYVLIDADSGKVLVAQNADQRLPPASLTKLMTSYVLSHELAEGRVSKEDKVLVSENSWAQNPVFAGSSLMWIEVGKEVKLADLHRGIVVSSGNDATVAIAEHLAGTESAFADVMNGHAAELGMHGSHFVNSHGLPDPDHYTTAYDLARLANALIKDYPEDYKLYKEREFTYNGIPQYNRNRLLVEDPSVDGLKTGYTSEAGYCLVASAKRDGMRLISVVLGTDSKRTRESESRKLLNYGFRYFETHALYETGQQITATRVWKGLQEELNLGVGEQIYLTLPRGRSEDLKAVMELDETIVAPISKGTAYGILRVSLDGEELVETPLIALQDIAEAGFFARLWDSIVMFITGFLDI